MAAARALADGRQAVFALIYDENNPYFRQTGRWPGWPRVLEGALAEDYPDFRFRSVSWQALTPLLPMDDSARAWASEKHRLPVPRDASKSEGAVPGTEASGGEGWKGRAEEWEREHPGEIASTAAVYSTGPHARIAASYWDYDDQAELTCPACGWRGRAKDADREHFSELFDVSCPACDQMLLIVSYPTLEETREAAERGNEDAQRELGRIETYGGE